MPRLFGIYLLSCLVTGSCLAQAILPKDTIVTFRLDRLPQQGVLLDKGWKWHAGDSANWSKTQSDYTQWESIDPTKDINDLPQLRQAGIGWLQLRLVISPSIQTESLALQIEQTGASEVYINGRLLHRFGQINHDSRLTKAYDPRGQPVSFPIEKDSHYILAIRFAYSDTPLYNTSYAPQNTNPAIRVIVNNVTNAVRFDQINRQNKSGLDYFKTGIFFILALLHCALYVYYPKQRANLYIFLFSLCCMLTYLLQAQSDFMYQVEALQIVRILIAIFTAFFHLLLLNALYSLFKRPLGVYYWVLFTFCLACIPLTLWPYRSGLNYGHGLFYLLCFLEYIRIAILAVRQKQHGSGIVMPGVIVALVFALIHVALLPHRPAIYAQFYQSTSTLTNAFYFGLLHLPYNISYLSIPVAISLYLGLEFAFTNQALETKLVEIERLSAYTLTQEQEKQALLTTENERLEEQVVARTAELQYSLNNLKATQTQLIQKEKMASLGELTAGIAHEIQNPLNFVNNFSEVSAELVVELTEELDKGDTIEAKAIAGDLQQNLRKINQHGQRASSIVKGMLEHSRTSTGERQLTDLNALATEYLRLAYQGLRAKDKAFNSGLITHFDSALPPVDVVTQEIGRVLLNLYNNAFYAVQQKQKAAASDYQPTVTLSTQQTNNQVEIRVKDNGTGIPESVKAKIFQPFFTTKPTGEGTGLGLSLSYDIITRGHGGTLTVESRQGEGTEFAITLPINAYPASR